MIERRLFLAQLLVMGETSEGFVSLFNGQDIDRWDGDEKVWTVDKGVIHANSEAAARLVYNGGSYRDFDLRYDMRVVKGSGGVRVREGLEAGMDGMLSSESKGARFGVFPTGKPAFRPGDWNEYKLVCKGDSAKIWVNASPVSEGSGLEARGGAIALQVGPRSQVEFRNVRANKFA